jgi:enoyl-CoA hydratase/carnithine racemase
VVIAMTKKTGENTALETKAPVNPPAPHSELIAAFRRAQADAAHKAGLIHVVAKKGPSAIQAAVETAAKAAKRRDTYAKKLSAVGVVLQD